MQIIQPKSILHRTRDAAYSLFYNTGLSHLYYQLAGRKRGIITYHNVLPDQQLPKSNRYSQDVTAAVMEYHLRFLSHNFGILPYSEINNSTAKGFLISFDDGMLNNYTVLLPLLEKYKVQAMFAICPDGVNGKIPYIWRDHLYMILKSMIGKGVFLPLNEYKSAFPVTALNIDSLNAQLKDWVYNNAIANLYGMVLEICKRNGINYRSTLDQDPSRFTFMNWDQVKDLHHRGHIIASHTLSHRIMRFLSEEEKWQELKYSKEEIQDNIGASVEFIVYPYGGEKEIDSNTIQKAKKAGYERGFMNVQYHSYGKDKLAQPRFGLPLNPSAPHLHATASGLTSFLKGKAV